MSAVRPVAALAAAVLTGSLLATASPSSALVPTVTIQGHEYSPTKMTVDLGLAVNWVNQDPSAHTATSDDGLFDTGTIDAGGDSALVTFDSSGRFRYHCSFHSDMHGQVVIPLDVVGGSATDGWKLRWATGAAPAGVAFDVQFKKASATEWRNLRTDTTHAAGKFNPTKPGTYVVRARTSNTADDMESGWTPNVSLTIS